VAKITTLLQGPL